MAETREEWMTAEELYQIGNITRRQISEILEGQDIERRARHTGQRGRHASEFRLTPQFRNRLGLNGSLESYISPGTIRPIATDNPKPTVSSTYDQTIGTTRSEPILSTPVYQKPIQPSQPQPLPVQQPQGKVIVPEQPSRSVKINGKEYKIVLDKGYSLQQVSDILGKVNQGVFGIDTSRKAFDYMRGDSVQPTGSKLLDFINEVNGMVSLGSRTTQLKFEQAAGVQFSSLERYVTNHPSVTKLPEVFDHPYIKYGSLELVLDAAREKYGSKENIPGVQRPVVERKSMWNPWRRL